MVRYCEAERFPDICSLRILVLRTFEQRAQICGACFLLYVIVVGRNALVIGGIMKVKISKGTPKKNQRRYI